MPKIYDSPFFRIQTRRRDRRGMLGCGRRGVAFSEGPFPDEATDEDLKEWYRELEREFQENLARATLDRMGENTHGQ
jgi:hypothetical protein